MTSKLKVNIIADGGDNAIMTSNGSGTLTLNNAALKNTPAFHMYATASTSVNSGAVTKIALGGSYIDTDSGVDTSNSKYTVPSGKGGKYLIGAEICFNGNANDVHLGIYVNGSHSYDSLNWWIEYGDSLQGASRSTLIDLAAGDYIELYTLTGTNVSINSDTSRTKLFGYRLIGV